MGEQELIQLRLAGRKPSLVNIDLDVGKLGVEACIQIKASDRVHEIDLRGVRGCVVAVSGADIAKVKRIALACSQAGASRVISTTHALVTPNRFEVIEVTDTDGIFTWTP